MTSPDYATSIQPEEFPDVFREVVREIGQLVLKRTQAIEVLEQQLLAIPDEDLRKAQVSGHFSRADIANRVARDFSVAMDGQRAASN